MDYEASSGCDADAGISGQRPSWLTTLRDATDETGDGDNDDQVNIFSGKVRFLRN